MRGFTFLIASSCFCLLRCNAQLSPFEETLAAIRFADKKTSLVLLGMALITEVAVLRILTLLLLIVLIGLSFYLVWEALQRCQVVTARLNQEIRDFHDLAQNSDSENE